RQRECQLSPRASLDQLADFIPVTRTSLEQREDQHLAAAFLQFRAEHMLSLAICSVPYYAGGRGTAATQELWPPTGFRKDSSMLSVTAPAPHDWVAVGGRRGEDAVEKLLVDASCLRLLYTTPR